MNPYTGEIVGRNSDQQFRPMLAIRKFHTHLLIRGRSGQMILTIAACCLLGLAVTGIVLWWPRKIFKLRRGRAHNVVFDLHQMLGLWSSVCVLLFALTGIVMGFEDQMNQWASNRGSILANRANVCASSRSSFFRHSPIKRTLRACATITSWPPLTSDS